MAKIESLTKEQEALLSIYRDRWMKIGLSTEPGNRARAESSVRRAYRIAGIEEPRQIVWSTSPLAGAMVISILQNEAVMKDLAKKLKGKAPKLGASVRASVWDSVGDSVGDSIYRAGYGSNDAAWLGFYQYFLEVLKIEACEKLIPLMDLAQDGGWWYPYRNICVMTEKPTQIHMKGTRIHCDRGPAVAYSDGFSVWALDGVRIPQWLAETAADEINPKQVLELKNAEQRLVGIKKIGAHRMLDALKAKAISKKGNEYVLYEVTLEGSKEKLLKMKNPSEPKEHYEWVAPEIKTVNKALAWRRGITIFNEPVAKA